MEYNFENNFIHVWFHTWRNQGSFSYQYFKTNYKFVPKDTILQYHSLYEKYKNNNIKNSTKVYSTQLSELPSYKLKNYVEENKLNITYGRKWTEIDSVIIGYNFIKEHYGVEKMTQYLVVPISYLKKHYPTHAHDKFEKIKQEYGLIDITDYNNMLSFNSKFSSLQQFPIVEGHIISSGHGNGKAFKQFEFFISLPKHIENNDIEVVFDEVLNGEFNKGIVIDEDMMGNLLTMIHSEDKENLNMAREIMANCEYEASEPYLAYLYNTHNKLKLIHGNNNYKLFLSRIKKYKIPTYYDQPSVDEILGGLIKIEPKFVADYTKCVKVHINYKLKRDIIKEIVLT
jgi:hypothetical protein